MAPEQDPLQVAVRALRHRDLSAAALDARLERAGVDEPGREEALETLVRVGYVDDARTAGRRAELLAARGWGDAAIAADLERQRFPPETGAEALAALPPERERVRSLIARRGGGAKTAAYLARRGFGEDAVEQALVAEDGRPDVG
jgi:SOS response regulatory protein OraA/RecX